MSILETDLEICQFPDFLKASLHCGMPPRKLGFWFSVPVELGSGHNVGNKNIQVKRGEV